MAKNKFLDQKWINCHLTEIKKKAGSRYTPELNVDLPISDIFYGLGRTQAFYIQIRSRLGKFNKAFRYVSSKYQDKEIQKRYKSLLKEIKPLVSLLSKIKEFNTTIIPWKTVNNRTKKAEDLTWKLLDKLREEKDKAEHDPKDKEKKDGRSISERLSSDIHYLYEAQKELRYFKDLSISTKAKLSNNPFLLLTGLAGKGKTHLLCDVVESRSAYSPPLPSVLVFGEFFTSVKDPWSQIANQLGFKLSKNEL